MDTEKRNKVNKLFAFNSFTGIIQFLLNAGLLLVCIPVFIINLGEEQFGVFSLIGVIGSLANFANISFDATLIKFLSEQGKSNESDTDILTAILLLLLILVPLTLIIYILKLPILHLLNISDVYIADTLPLFTYALIANFFLILGRIFTAILDAKQKIYLNNFALFLYNILYWGGIILIIVNGGGLKDIGLSILASALVWFVFVLILSTKIWGKFNLYDFKNKFHISTRKQLTYSLKIYTGGLLGFFAEPLTKILISNLLGVSWTGIYEIGLRIKSQLSSIFFRMLYPLLPIIAKSSAFEDIKQLVKRISEIIFYLIAPILIGVIFYTKPFILLWLGEQNLDVITDSVIILIFSSVLFSMPVIPIYFYLRTKNHPEKEIYIQATNVIINLIIIFLFYRQLGYYAVLAGAFISQFFSFLLCLYYQYKYLHVLPFSGFSQKIKFILCIFLVCCVSVLFYNIFSLDNIVGLILKVIITGIGALVIYYLLRVFNKEDLEIIK